MLNVDITIGSHFASTKPQPVVTNFRMQPSTEDRDGEIHLNASDN
jgi:hypothetical protein